ncbi:MAG: hypothetical protein US51_C0016G0002 [Microgenomates group bacterium GW2011_GWA2_37_6]|nr:MAG: hypothetical protein US51_C0016G0002 [Microgenomates group bacterium GW2011_GWA2_37_6]
MQKRKEQQLQQPHQSPDNNQQSTLIEREIFSGPLPHPRMLKMYEEALPGAAERIFKMAEGQTSHRQTLEKKVIESNIKNERLGMNYALILTLAFMACGLLLIYTGKEAIGFAALFGPGGVHAVNYAYRKYLEKTIPRKKEQQLQNRLNKSRK